MLTHLQEINEKVTWERDSFYGKNKYTEVKVIKNHIVTSEQISLQREVRV